MGSSSICNKMELNECFVSSPRQKNADEYASSLGWVEEEGIRNAKNNSFRRIPISFQIRYPLTCRYDIFYIDIHHTLTSNYLSERDVTLSKEFWNRSEFETSRTSLN